MNAKAVRYLTTSLIGMMGLVTISCSSGPEPPAVGSPAYYWAAAKQTWSTCDYMKTSEHLEKIARTQNEFTTRAQVWNLVLTSGLVKSHAEMADYFELGAKARAYNPTQFRRQMSDFRTYANRLSLAFVQNLTDFQKNNKDAKIPFDFPFPAGSAVSAPQVTKISAGDMPAPAALEDLRVDHMKTSVILATCRALGVPEDAPKAQQMMAGGNAEIPRETFLLGMAQALEEQARMYGHSKLDMPDKLKLYVANATDTLKVIPASDATKKLSDNIQKTLKLVDAK